MGAHRFTKRLATGLVLALSSVFAPQTVGAVSEGSLHPSWSDSAMAEGWRAVCGDVRNVGHVPARSDVTGSGPMRPACSSGLSPTTSAISCVGWSGPSPSGAGR